MALVGLISGWQPRSGSGPLLEEADNAPAGPPIIYRRGAASPGGRRGGAGLGGSLGLGRSRRRERIRSGLSDRRGGGTPKWPKTLPDPFVPRSRPRGTSEPAPSPPALPARIDLRSTPSRAPEPRQAAFCNRPPRLSPHPSPPGSRPERGARCCPLPAQCPCAAASRREPSTRSAHSRALDHSPAPLAAHCRTRALLFPPLPKTWEFDGVPC